MRRSRAITSVMAGVAVFVALGLVFPWVTVVSSVVIDRPLPDIWTLVADADRMPQWLCGLRSVELLSGESQRPGSSYRVTVELIGVESTVEVTIALVERQRRYVLEATADWGRLLTDVRFTHTPRGVDITISTVAAADRLPGRSLLVLMRSSLSTRQDTSLRRLRALIENEVPPYAQPLADAGEKSPTVAGCAGVVSRR